LLQADGYFKLFEYKKAALNDSLVLDRYSKSLDSAKVSDKKNDLLVRKA